MRIKGADSLRHLEQCVKTVCTPQKLLLLLLLLLLLPKQCGLVGVLDEGRAGLLLRELDWETILLDLNLLGLNIYLLTRASNLRNSNQIITGVKDVQHFKGRLCSPDANNFETINEGKVSGNKTK